MRLSYDELMKVGEPPAPPEQVNRAGGFSPKYDPFTGELIRPIEVKPDTTPHPAIPIATPAIGYASGDTREPGMFAVFALLLQPMNLFVMLAVLLMHLVIEIVGIAASVLFFLMPVKWFLTGVLFSHYGCVLEETGSTRNDEMPRPLRDLGWHEDLWGPFVQVFGALLICFAPASTVLHNGWFGDWNTVVVAALAVAGCLLAPAVLITMTTSGSYLNPRPDRLLSVIRGIGARYIILVVMFVVSLSVYIGGFVGAGLLSASIFAPPGAQSGHVPVLAAMLLLGIYLMHAFCWMCGLAYRRGYEHFDWVLQRHISTRHEQEAQRRAESLARLSANSARAKQRLT
jgi:hypothetical protein